MRILHVVRGIGWPGGMKEYVAELAAGLDQHGHEVVVLAAGTAPAPGEPPHPSATGLEIVWHPKSRFAGRFTYPKGLARSLRHWSLWADVIHVHQPFFIGTWLAALGRRPLAATFYLHPEHLTGRHRRLRQAALRLLIRRSDLVVAVSHAEQELIHSVAPPRRTIVVWPALRARPSTTSATGGGPTVITVGRMDAEKGITHAVAAMLLLPAEVTFGVVGGGPLRAEVEDLCRSAGTDPERVLLGVLSDEQVDQFLTAATVFVSASREESFGIAALKAIAHGCRPVLSDIPSHREIIRTLKVDGTLFAPDMPPQQLAAVIADAVVASPSDPAVIERVPLWTDSAKLLADGYSQLLRASAGTDRSRRSV